MNEDMSDWAEEEKQGWGDGTFETKETGVFNSTMTEFFQDSDVEELILGMFAHIKTEIEYPALPKSGLTLDYIMHLDIDFHKLELTRGALHIDLPKWVAGKKVVIDPKNKDEECFKWAVIAALHHQEIKCNPERVSKLKPFADHYDWTSTTQQ